MMNRTIRIALLICDTPPPAVVDEFGDYLNIYRNWLLTALSSYPDAAISGNTELILDPYDVVDKLEYPPEEKLVSSIVDGYDVVMLTGSKHTAQDTETPFIPPLIRFIRNLATSPSTQHVKIVGVCFGMQVISIAMGGQCLRGDNGWEVGVYGNEMTKEGRYWWTGDVEGQGGGNKVYLQQMHRDYVPTPPPDFHLLLKTPRYPVHSMIKYHSASTIENPLAHVFCVQGHPEFSPGIVSHITDARSEAGIFDGPATAEARRRAGGKDGSGGEGFGRVGWAIWRVILQDLPVQNSSNGNRHITINGMINENGEGSSSQVRRFLDDEERYAHVDKVLERTGPWTVEQYLGASLAKEFLRSTAKILVIGAGGLGCEILPNLALTGFHDIHVIDMDTIDISNLNRQFLFRETDVGNSKANVAADFVMRRVPGVKVTPYHGKIQDHPHSFYKQFDIIIAGLDSISARRWINATLVQIAEEDSECIKYLIDGGTEGFKGQSRVIVPSQSSCYECTIDMLTPPTAYPICTIANTPRLPEHCIEWASVLEWPKVFKEKKLDTDDPDHIEWLYQKASTRAAEFKIDRVTWALTQGVVKNIIPAIASTNAVIAASCCNEAFKLATGCAPPLKDYMMYTGNESVYTYTFQSYKRDECPVCGGESLPVKVGRDWTLEKLVDWLEGRQELQITRPSLSYGTGTPLFYQAPPQLNEMTKPNLDKRLGDLLEDGSEVVVTAPGLPFSLTVTLNFE